MLSITNLRDSGSIVSNRAPKVLLVTAYRWPTTTRLALAICEAGLAVEALCPAGHSLARVKFVSKVYRYRPLTPLRDLRIAIAASEPDLIIPSDDTTAAQLHELYRLSDPTDCAGNKLRSIIARSLGDPTGYPIFYSRARMASLASGAGVLSPTTTNIRNYDELLDQLENVGLPAVLKSDGSFGGMGVALVRTRAEARHMFGRLAAYNSVARTIKRLIVDRDANLILPCLRRDSPQISIQPFIVGERANAAVACWKGAVLAQVFVKVIASNEETGPATVVSVIAHPGMSQAVERLVRALNLSGLCGFDFILDSKDGSAHLIDFNPRATQTCHLLSSERTRPVVSLAAKLRGLPPVVDDRLVPHPGPIALFPHSLASQPNNSYSKYAETDLPTKSPELVKIGLEFHRQSNRFLAKAFRLANKKQY